MPHPALRLAALAFIFGSCASIDEVVFETREGELRFVVTVAEDEDARRRGLMGSSRLEENEGLLLVFPGPSEVCLVNSGVDFAIDAVFIVDGEDGGLRVGEVLAGIAANDPEPRCAEASYVLEVDAGASRAIDRGAAVVVNRQ